MITTIQKYALSKGTSPQNVRQSKTLPIVKLTMYVKHKGVEIPVGEQLFIETEK